MNSTNRINAILAEHGLSEMQLQRECAPAFAQTSINRIKNGHIASPTVATAWRIVRGLRAATGQPLTFEDVFPEVKP
jgi:hypothetical protein